MRAGIAIQDMNVLDAGWTRHRMPEGAEQQ
jgi:hypothetical protein